MPSACTIHLAPSLCQSGLPHAGYAKSSTEPQATTLTPIQLRFYAFLWSIRHEHDLALLQEPSCAGDEPEKRTEILNRLFHGGMDMSKPTWIEPPFTADYVSIPHSREWEQAPPAAKQATTPSESNITVATDSG